MTAPAIVTGHAFHADATPPAPQPAPAHARCCAPCAGCHRARCRCTCPGGRVPHAPVVAAAAPQAHAAPPAPPQVVTGHALRDDGA